VRRYLSEAPLGYIYKAFRKKDIKANGHWIHKDYILQEGDVVRIYVTDQQLADFAKPREATKAMLPYPIVYEDEAVLIVDKPSGLLVIGDEEEKRNTLARKVLDYLYFKGEFDPNNHAFVPSPAHRLDRNTAGLVVFGKTDAALKELEELFKDRTEIDKRYTALVAGVLKGKGEINAPLKKNPESGLVSVTPSKKAGKKVLPVTSFRRTSGIRPSSKPNSSRDEPTRSAFISSRLITRSSAMENMAISPQIATIKPYMASTISSFTRHRSPSKTWAAFS
jgi:23S rRNA pseudouridine955/2504/2580 synthase